jgi:hypothetical protein
VWSLYPDISEEQDLATGSWAAKQASVLFVKFLAAYGIDARPVAAEQPDTPFHEYHWWVRVDCPLGTVNVDWTARQFHNLEHPPLAAHADLSFPMVWLTGFTYPADTNPASGKYRKITDPASADTPLP